MKNEPKSSKIRTEPIKLKPAMKTVRADWLNELERLTHSAEARLSGIVKNQDIRLSAPLRSELGEILQELRNMIQLLRLG